MSDSDIKTETKIETKSEQVLYCKWKDCLRPFTDHQALSQHLSDDHIGWKKEKYCCEWTGCSRQGIKCHNRFALMMHLRIHTGEKPYECDIDGCGMNFGRMDALTRHKKSDHGIDTQIDQHVKKETITNSTSQNPSSSSSIQSQQQLFQENRKRKLAREDDDHDKRKRERNEQATHEPTSDMEESEDMEAYDHHHRPITTTTLEHYPSSSSSSSLHPSQHQQKSQLQQPIAPSTTLSISPSNLSQNKYKVTKAKLQYILRENEMLNDEWTSLQKKLKRLQTERRVLLDVLMSTEDPQDDEDAFSFEEDEEEVVVEEGRDEEDHHHHHQDTHIEPQQDQPLDNQPSMVDVL